MALRGKEVRPYISEEMHERLAIMAEFFNGRQIAELAAEMLEEAIAGKWHSVRLLIERSERLGKRRKILEGEINPPEIGVGK